MHETRGMDKTTLFWVKITLGKGAKRFSYGSTEGLSIDLWVRVGHGCRFLILIERNTNGNCAMMRKINFLNINQRTNAINSVGAQIFLYE